MQRVFVLASVLAFPLSAAAFTGNDLNMLCTKTDTASRSACAAYIEGAADGIYNTIEAIGGTSGPQVGQYFCLPVDVKPQELSDAVRKFIAENPTQASYNATTIISLGLGKAFPCKAEK
ncbi:Rap1a/Tai family immunity protein [Caballeronia sp.]|jgi:hypothetical protein|uniref:Rap1a/Tai family immunity protein n=1 Tax=Caballeronia sp. TaxID=1931223 RepID=UPI003C4FC442